MSVLLLFSGCADKEEPAQITISESSIEYFEDRMDFPSEGGSQVIKFSTNKNWEISVSESGMGVDWCTVSPKSGVAGDVTLTISVPENTTYDERSVILTIAAGDALEKLRVSQKQNDAILLSYTLYEVPMEGGEIQLQVRSNVNYHVEIPEQYRGWIHKGNSTRSLESKDLIFTIDNNLDYDKRQGEIIISDGNITEVVKVYQAGGGILVLSENQYNVPSNGGTVTIDLSSNFEYEFELPNVDWLKLATGTRGMSSHTIYFEVSPNEGYDNRSASIRFYDPSGTVSETVTVNQVQKDALIISTKEFSVDAGLNYLSVDINTNIEYEVEIPQEYASWIRQAENPLTRTLNPYKLVFVISENDTFESREGKIIIKGKDKDISDVVVVDQAQNDAIFIESPKDVNMSYEGGVVNVEVNSNVDVELDFLQDWTHFADNQTRGLVKLFHSFVVDKNDTPYERVGTIIIRKMGSNLPADSMYVHQEKGFLTLNVNNGNLQSLLQPYDLSKIEKLKLKGSLNNNEWLLIQEMTNLAYLNIREINQDMPSSLFKNNKSVKIVWMPQYSEIIKSSTFEGSSIQQVHFSSMLKKVEYRAFYECMQLKEATLPNTVEEIDICAFDGCNNTPFSKLPQQLQLLGESALWHTKFDGSCIEIPNSMTYIGPYALADCFDSTESILFNYNVPSFSAHSFEGADFKNVYIKAQVPPIIDAIYFGNRYLYVPIGSKRLYEEAPVWKNFMVIEEIDFDNFVIPGSI